MNLRSNKDQEDTIKLLLKKRATLKANKKKTESEIGDINQLICSNLGQMIEEEYSGHQFVMEVTVFDHHTAIELFIDNGVTISRKHPTNILTATPSKIINIIKGNIDQVIKIRDNLVHEEEHEVYKYSKQKDVKPSVSVYTSTRTKYF